MKHHEMIEILNDLTGQAGEEDQLKLVQQWLRIAKVRHVTPAQVAALNQLHRDITKARPVSAEMLKQAAKPAAAFQAGEPGTVVICRGKACRAKGADAILTHFKSLATAAVAAGRKPCKVNTCSCQGMCKKAPVVIIDKKIHENFILDE